MRTGKAAFVCLNPLIDADGEPRAGQAAGSAHLVPVKINFGALCLYLGFLSKFFAVLLWKSETCGKHHRPKGQWGSVKTTLRWKGPHKDYLKLC